MQLWVCLHVCIGLLVKSQSAFFDVYISCCHVPELNVMEVTDNGLVVGAAVTLTDFASKLKELVQTLEGIHCNSYVQ